VTHTTEIDFTGLYTALHQNRHRLREPDAALGYLRATAVNNARSVLRKRQTVRRHLRLARQENAEPADSEVLLAAAHQQVLAAVRQLPPRQREVLALRYWANLSEAEIAQALSISRGAVKSNASRGMDKLGTILGDVR
jgi:RNA polymerase sigma factor (sigma-70 family)